MLADINLVPFEPPAKPLGLAGLITLWRNYIETIPRSAYEEAAATRIQTRLADTLLISDPALIQEILVEKADRFGRDPATRRSFAPVIGTTSLFLAEGADWRWHRRDGGAAGRTLAHGTAGGACGRRGGYDPHHLRHHRRGDPRRIGKPRRRA